MIWRRLRRFLCRIGVDGACYHDGQELEERAARMRMLTWQLEVSARDYLPERDTRKDGPR